MKTRTHLWLVSLSFVFAACGGGSSPDDLCKHLSEIAEKEGGEAKEKWESRLADDCVEEVKEIKEELGDNYSKFADCVKKATKFSSAFKDCDPDKFE